MRGILKRVEIWRFADAHFVEVKMWSMKGICILPDTGGGLCVQSVWQVLTQDMHSREARYKECGTLAHRF